MSVMAGDDGNCFWRDRGGDLMHVERSPPQYTARQVKRFFTSIFGKTGHWILVYFFLLFFLF